MGMRFNSPAEFLSSKKVVEDVEKPRAEEDNGHKFLLRNLTENDEHSHEEHIEMQRADRAEFVQMLSLASIQHEELSTII